MSTFDAARREVEGAHQAVERARERMQENTKRREATASTTAVSSDAGAEAQLSDDAVRKAVWVLYLNNVLTPVATQAYTPSVPLFATLTLHISVYTLGLVFATLTVCSLVSFSIMAPLLKHFTVRQILLGDYAVRIFSGVLYMLSVKYGFAEGASSTLALPLLFASRLVYGITLNSFGISSVWAGVRVGMADRATTVTRMNGLVALGITLGPSISSALAGLFKEELIQMAIPALITLTTSVLMFLLILNFDDGGMLPSSPAPKAAAGAGVDAEKAASDDKERQRVVTIVATGVCVSLVSICIASMSGIEALMSLMMYDGYGWDAAEQTPLWVYFGLNSVVSVFLVPLLVEHLNWVQFIIPTYVGLAMCVVPINFSDWSTPTAPWMFYVGVTGISLINWAYMGHLALLAERVPKEQQVKYSSMAQALGQAGRAIGPVLATGTYGAANGLLAGSGVNAGWLFMAAVLAMGYAYTTAHFTTIYGSCSDPSKAALKKAKQTTMM